MFSLITWYLAQWTDYFGGLTHHPAGANSSRGKALYGLAQHRIASVKMIKLGNVNSHGAASSFSSKKRFSNQPNLGHPIRPPQLFPCLKEIFEPIPISPFHFSFLNVINFWSFYLGINPFLFNLKTGNSFSSILMMVTSDASISHLKISHPSNDILTPIWFALQPPNCVFLELLLWQEEYVTGDDVGALDCGHDFHTNCIKQWLKQKNICPICKMTGLGTWGKSIFFSDPRKFYLSMEH